MATDEGGGRVAPVVLYNKESLRVTPRQGNKDGSYSAHWLTERRHRRQHGDVVAELRWMEGGVGLSMSCVGVRRVFRACTRGKVAGETGRRR
jgi:hypothetical protein